MAFTPSPNPGTTTGVDGTNKDRRVLVGELQVGDVVLGSADVSPLGTVGAVTTAATTVAVEAGDASDHVTKLTMTEFAVGTGGDNAALGIGAKFYTLPAGTILIKKATLVGALTFDADVTTGSPEVGIGTVIASGAVSVLSGTATFEDVMDGNASGGAGGDTTGNLAGTTIYKSSDSTTRDGVMIKATGGKAHDLFLNVAVTWPNVDLVGPPVYTGAVTFTGTIVLEWAKID